MAPSAGQKASARSGDAVDGLGRRIWVHSIDRGPTPNTALAIGVPLGVASGRAYWRMFADRLGARPEVVTPMMGLVLLVTLALLLANLLAAVPAWGAARTKPAPALRGQ